PARQVRAGLLRPLPHPHHVATGTVDIGHHVAWGWRLHTRCAPQVVPVTGEPFHQTVDRSPATSLAGGLVDFALPLDHLPGAVGSLPLPDDVLAGSVLALGIFAEDPQSVLLGRGSLGPVIERLIDRVGGV